jgi:hypothetical protein
MGFRIENKATELLIHDVGRKNITYYSKDNLSVKAEAGEIVILDNNEEILRADSTQIDDPSVNGVYDLVTTIKAYLQSDGGDSFSGGWADYADFATTGTPLNVTAVYSVITNDGLSVNTNTSYLPEGVTQLWDSSTNSFDWSELKIGDMIDIRLDLSVTIVTNNTAVDVDLFMGFGGSIDVPFISAQNFKTSGTYNLIRYQGLYIGSEDVRNNAAQLKIKADHNCTCVVNGWYVRCIRKGIV